jgi:hypothetical protein
MSSLALLAECLRRSQQNTDVKLCYRDATLERLESDTHTPSTNDADDDDDDDDDDKNVDTTVHFLLRGFVVDVPAPEGSTTTGSASSAAVPSPGTPNLDVELTAAACRKKLGSHLQFKVLPLSNDRCALLLPHAHPVGGAAGRRGRRATEQCVAPLRLATLSELADENVRLRYWLAATGDGRAVLQELQDEFDSRAKRNKDNDGGESDDERPPVEDDESAYEQVLQRKFEAEAELAAWKELLAQE